MALAGLYPPLVTPFAADGSVDLAALERLVRHFEEIVARSPVPVLVYNVSYRTGLRLDAGALLTLADIDGVAGMKQSAGAIDEDTVRLMTERPDGFAVLCGDDALIQPLVAMGGDGAISASAHVATERFAALARDASPREAGALAPLARALFAEPNPAVIKAVLHAQRRIPTPDVRLPMTAASDAARDRALAVLP